MLIKDNNKVYDVCLEDDGTIDTVLSVNSKEFRFSSDYTTDNRDEFGGMTEDGFYDLAYEAIEAYEELLLL